MKEWERRDPAYQKARQRNKNLRRYGLTQDDFSALLAQQGNRCAICKTDKPASFTKHKDPGHLSKGWVVDHCHTTGKVRGILCGGCNVGLGVFKDEPLRLAEAVRYLEKQCRI